MEFYYSFFYLFFHNIHIKLLLCSINLMDYHKNANHTQFVLRPYGTKLSTIKSMICLCVFSPKQKLQTIMASFIRNVLLAVLVLLFTITICGADIGPKEWHVRVTNDLGGGLTHRSLQIQKRRSWCQSAPPLLIGPLNSVLDLTPSRWIHYSSVVLSGQVHLTILMSI